MTPKTLTAIAKRCQAALCALDPAEPPWTKLGEAARASLVDGVRFYVENPDAESADGHAHWIARRASEGWAPSAVKVDGLPIDPLYALKLHPAIAGWHVLDEAYKAKHRAFRKAALAAIGDA